MVFGCCISDMGGEWAVCFFLFFSFCGVTSRPSPKLFFIRFLLYDTNKPVVIELFVVDGDGSDTE